jgi:hypothetical protein
MLYKMVLSAVILGITAVAAFSAPPWCQKLPPRVRLVDRTVPYYAGNPRPIPPRPVAYPYGYFGAQYRPYFDLHRGYYYTYHQWTYSTGY